MPRSTATRVELHFRERFIGLLEDAFLVRRAKRFDVKGRRYIGAPLKFYFADLGLRNARTSFGRFEPTHIMENVTCNELICRGFGVDVGAVPTNVRSKDGVSCHSQLEIDFFRNKGSRRYYIQSAYALPNEGKRDQDRRPLIKVDDPFKKVVVTKGGPAPHYDNAGILTMNVYDFLLGKDSLLL